MDPNSLGEALNLSFALNAYDLLITFCKNMSNGSKGTK